MIYIIDRENKFHVAEYLGRSHRYFTKCGEIINKSDRVMTLNFGDFIRYMCPLCKSNFDFGRFTGKESLCYDLKDRAYDTASRLMQIMELHERGHTIIKPEFVYSEAISRIDPGTRLKQRASTRKNRKNNVY